MYTQPNLSVHIHPFIDSSTQVLNRDRLVFLLGTTPMIVATFSLFDASLQGIYTDSIPSSTRRLCMGACHPSIFHPKCTTPIFNPPHHPPPP